MAWQSPRDIKRRIKSVSHTQQITRAMQLVSAAKLRRVQEMVERVRPYTEKIEAVLTRITASEKDAGKHPLLAERPVNKVLYCVFTANRGLAGGYNINVARLAAEKIGKEQHEPVLIVVGKKGREYFQKQNQPMAEVLLGLDDDISWPEAKELAGKLQDYFLEGRVDEVNIVYTKFAGTLTQYPTVQRLLPLRYEKDGSGTDDPAADGEFQKYLVEPSLPAVLDVLVPRYVETVVYQLLMEAKASEHSARMNAMRNATDNAEEMINELVMTYNRARQASITKEITEIVGGAEALSGSWS
ncbi:MAG TPA: ATP synthase F1 subunit gamma [Firmicutes bacterium]|nr:ATP synthase F1 subunit gamma [Bacillota bacterium]